MTHIEFALAVWLVAWPVWLWALASVEAKDKPKANTLKALMYASIIMAVATSAFITGIRMFIW